jgi:hypothetical protein
VEGIVLEVRPECGHRDGLGAFVSPAPKAFRTGRKPKRGGARPADGACPVRKAKPDRPMLARRKQRKAGDATSANLPYLKRRAKNRGTRARSKRRKTGGAAVPGAVACFHAADALPVGSRIPLILCERQNATGRRSSEENGESNVARRRTRRSRWCGGSWAIQWLVISCDVPTHELQLVG